MDALDMALETNHESRMAGNRVLTNLLKDITDHYGTDTIVVGGQTYIRTETVRDLIEKNRPPLADG